MWGASTVSTYCASDEDEVVETASQQPSTSSSRGGKKKKTTADLPLTSQQQQPSSIKQEVKQEPPPVLSADVAIQVDDDVALSPPIKTEAVMMYEDLKTRLECPVCSKICLPPVMQCRNGHSTCNACRAKIRSCPTCREIDIDVRNLFAEQAVVFMSMACEYAMFGCTVEMTFRDKDTHQRQCKFRPYNCPYIECEQKFVAKDVVPHVSTEHREDCRNSDGPEITASMILIGNYFGGDGAWSPRVITCFGRTFFDVALTREKLLHHWVWLLGEEDEAEAFTYEITAFKGPNTKYMYAGEVSSLRTPDTEIVSTGQCLSINDGMGKRLREKDKDGKDKIRYKLKLSRKERFAPAEPSSPGLYIEQVHGGAGGMEVETIFDD